MPATGLPSPSTSLIGRETEITRLLSWTSDPGVRLITLTGPGGVGKTRLALEVVDIIGDQGDFEVTIVSLAALRDAELVAPTIGQSFGLSDADAESLPARLAFALKHQPTLLVLDNFEYLLDAAPIISDCLQACRSLTVLVTSRIALRLSAEREFQVAPLAVPTADLPSRNGENPSMQLFLERAGIDADQFTPEDWKTSAEICRRADGLPLAIELAAAKTRLLSLPELLSRMDHALPILVDGHRDAPQRLRTMRDAIAWSYDLLSSEEQEFFCRLSVLSGGFTIAGAEGVAAHGPEFETLAALQTLLDHSLIKRVVAREGPQRFSMLETIREYGQERLSAADRYFESRSVHARWFAGTLDSHPAEDAMGLNQTPTSEFPGDEDNLRAALDWSLSEGDGISAAKLATRLWPFWWTQGFFSEARDSLARVLEISASLSPTTLSSLLGMSSELALQQSQFELSGTLANEALHIAQSIPDIDRIRWHLRQVGWATTVSDPSAAIGPVEEIVEIGERTGDRPGTVRALCMLAMVKVYNDRLSEAIVHALDAQEIIDTLENPDASLIGESSQLRGTLAFYSGEYQRALPLLTQGLAARRAQGNRVYEMHCLRDLGRLSLALNDRSTAVSYFSQALEIAYLLGSEHGKSYCFDEAAAAGTNDEHSARLLGVSAAIRQRLRLSSIPTERALREETTARLIDSMGETRFKSAFEQGANLTTMEAYQIARQSLATATDHQSELHSVLTNREREVLILITQGRTDREIGETLFISHRTAATHAGNVLTKLGVHSRAEATAWAVRNNVA